MFASVFLSGSWGLLWEPRREFTSIEGALSFAQADLVLITFTGPRHSLHRASVETGLQALHQAPHEAGPNKSLVIPGPPLERKPPDSL
jgi:hypothetical protein